MVDFAKRLQSRLSDKGYRFKKEECRQAIAAVSATPLEPSDEEMAMAFTRLVASAQEEIQAIVPVQAEEIQPQESAPEITIPTPETFDIPVEDLPCLQPPAGLTVPENSSQIAQTPVSGISQIEVGLAVNQAIAQLGATGNQEAVNILSSLAQELMAEIGDIEEMTSTLITAYLNKRQNVLASAIGTIESLRSAQSTSFQSGRDESFFDRKNRNKQQFLNQIQATFN